MVLYPTLLFAGPVEDLQPGEWYEVPNSRIIDVVMNPNPPGVDSVEGPSAIINDWSGGAYDIKRDRLIVWGGGHQGYAGNELYAFDINTLGWERLTDPSSLVGFVDGNDQMPDGRPVSVHTYDQLEYIPPPIDRFWSQGGSMYINGRASRATWMFDFDTREWERKSNVIGGFYTDVVGYSGTSAYDPQTGNILFWGDYYFVEYNPNTDTWSYRSEMAFQKDGMTGALDPVRRKFVSIGRGDAYYLDLSQSGLLLRHDLMTNGANEIQNCDAPGLEYDPVSDKLVAWCSGSSVYTLDLDNNVWEKRTATNSVNPGNHSSAYHGTFGRFRYIPSKNAFIVVADVSKNVFIYKLAEGAGTPPVFDEPPPVQDQPPVDDPVDQVIPPGLAVSDVNTNDVSAGALDPVSMLLLLLGVLMVAKRTIKREPNK